MFDLFPRLAERRRQLGGPMSGGERRMLAMVRALMGRPRLIRLDEPMVGLPPEIVDYGLGTIRTFEQPAVIVFMAEQNAALALGLTDWGYIVKNGRLELARGRRSCWRIPPCGRCIWSGGWWARRDGFNLALAPLPRDRLEVRGAL